MIRIRASAAPLLFSCASSGDDELLIDYENPGANLGNATHDAMESEVQGERADLDAIALRWTCEREELGRLVWYGRQLWQDMAPGYANPQTEVPVFYKGPDIELTGHIDVIARYPKRVLITDWKSGYLDKNFYHQLMVYAVCLILSEGYEEVVASVGWLRDQEQEHYTFTRPIVVAWLDRLREQVKRKGRYTIGSHCPHCPRSHSCPAALADARQAVTIFSSEAFSSVAIAPTLAELPESERVRLFRQAKAVLKLGEAAKTAIRLNVIQNGGHIDSGDGWLLKVKEEVSRRRLDTAKVCDIIEAHLNEDEKASVIDVSLSRFEEIVAKRAGKGHSATAKRALIDEIVAADALNVSTTQKLVERRKDTEE